MMEDSAGQLRQRQSLVSWVAKLGLQLDKGNRDNMDGKTWSQTQDDDHDYIGELQVG